MKQKEIAARALDLSGESDERLLARLERSRYTKADEGWNDPVTRQAARRVLRLRGYTFDKQTGQMLGGPREAVVKRSDL